MKTLKIAMLLAFSIFASIATYASGNINTKNAQTISVNAQESSEETPEQTFETLAPSLNAKSFRDKAKAIEIIAEIDDPRVLPTLKAMQESKLYYKKDDKSLVIISDAEDGLEITDIYTETSLGVVKKSKIKKVKINNRLRRKLRTIVAIASLSSSDKAVRYESIKNLLKTPSAELKDGLLTALEKEESQYLK